jgi:hypothetical protein
VPGWNPHFPASVADDAEPGTVFQTHAHGDATTWVVTDRDPGRRIRYARVTPTRAGTVTVAIDGAGAQTVTYELTALTAAAADLHQFALDYPAFLRSWQDTIEARLRKGDLANQPQRPRSG